jgi:Rrf2 family iron-sulfur cluster assembly transcriptional regulator
VKLTSKGRYAVTAMLDLAFHSQAGPVTLSQISMRQDISLSYLEQLFARLRKQNLVGSTRGPGGGYTLSRPADRIAISEIIAAVDETVETTRCKGAGNCQEGGRCLTHELWDDLSQQIYRFLNGITLAGLMEEQCIQDVSLRQDRKMHQQPKVDLTRPVRKTHQQQI